MSDECWERVRPLIPPAPSHAKGGRPRLGDRQAFEAIVYALRTGIQWNALPKEAGASSTVHDRFQEWERADFFQALWQAELSEYDELVGIEWEWQSVDGANRHDVRLLSATLDGLVIGRPEPTAEQPQHVCVDAAYDSTPVYKELLARHYQPHVRSRGKRNTSKSSSLAIGHAVGPWNVLIPGSISRADSWFAGKRNVRITSPFFIWPALN